MAATTTLTVADNNDGRLRKRKGEGVGLTWLPDTAPGGAEGQEGWADMVHCFEQSSMRESVSNMIHAVGINTEQNNQDFFFFGLAGRLEDYQKGVL